MTDNTHNPLEPQEDALEPSESVVQIDASEDSADLGTDFVEGKVAEIAKDSASENKAATAGKSQADPQATTHKREETELTDRVMLREKLLKTAPQEAAMRHEVVRALEVKKQQLETDIRGYDRRQEYDMLSKAVGQLRAVVRQLEIAARAGYDALREIWLKVIHKFA